MAGEADKTAWIQLGQMLELRRVRLERRYANLTLFTQERGLDYRVAWDVEHAARTNYRRATLSAIEVAYGLEPRSIEAFVNDGVPLSDMDENPYEDDPGLSEVWRRSRGLSLQERHGLVDLARKMRDNKQPNGKNKDREGNQRRA